MPSEPGPAPLACSFDVGRHRIAVIDGRAGRTGPPLVFIHGIALSAQFWPLILKDTSLDRYPWIALGLPGHYPGAAPAEFSRHDVTPELFADCVTGPVREYFGGEPAHLIGWSTGGFASLAAAAREPALVQSVVSISGFARGRCGTHLGTMQWMASRRFWNSLLARSMHWFGRSPRLFAAFLKSLAARKMELPPEILDPLLADFSQHDTRTMCEIFAGLRELDFSQSLGEIQAPVLILGGAADRVIPSAEAHYLHEHLPHSQLVEFPGMGHMFFGEGREGVFGRIGQWIEEY